MRKKVLIALKMAGIAGQEKLSGIFRFLGETRAWDITLVRTAAEFTPERVEQALRERYDGFIVSIPDTARALAPLATSATPTVVLDIHDPAVARRMKNIVFIRNSSREIGSAAANHLMSTGRCRSYAFVHNPAVREWSVERFRAFRDMLRDHDLWCHELAEPAALARLQKPVGVFAANDDRGYDVLEWCRAHRVRVPEDALVIGINNDTLICENCRPNLTSIQPDFEQEGFLAGQALDAMMDSKAPCGRQTHHVGVRTIVNRASTTDITHGGKLVQKAVAYIRSHACDGISARDVVTHMGCSRRLADLRFRELQGTSIGELIIRTRLDAVCRRLSTTREPMDAIAADCGFANANYLKNLFKRRFGMTMRAWRTGPARETRSPNSPDA